MNLSNSFNFSNLFNLENIYNNTIKQNYPKGSLYIVATPIGNLADISIRALYILSLVDFIACEDTRNTQNLLNNYNINSSKKRLIPVHKFNEKEASKNIIELLKQGKRIAYVSDAGTPTISDPGSYLCQNVKNENLLCVPIPGCSSVITALSVAGITEKNEFLFLGFLSNKNTERQKIIKDIAKENNTIILLEAPHRIIDLAKLLIKLNDRQITLARELTKQFEQIIKIRAKNLLNWLNEDKNRIKGEFVIIIHGINNKEKVENNDENKIKELIKILLEDNVTTKSATKILNLLTGLNKNYLYQKIIEIKNK